MGGGEMCRLRPSSSGPPTRRGKLGPGQSTPPMVANRRLPYRLAAGSTAPWSRMPPARKTPAAASKLPPSRRSSSFEDVHAAIERVTPDVLALLRDGVPRSKATLIAALTDRHEGGHQAHAHASRR